MKNIRIIDVGPPATSSTIVGGKSKPKAKKMKKTPATLEKAHAVAPPATAPPSSHGPGARAYALSNGREFAFTFPDGGLQKIEFGMVILHLATCVSDMTPADLIALAQSLPGARNDEHDRRQD